MEKLQIVRALRGNKSNIWLELQDLLERLKPIDLAVGYANFLPDENILAALKTAVNDANPMLHQYSKNIAGHHRLLKAISDFYSPIMQRDISLKDEILVTVGATNAIDCAIRSHVNPSEEVIVIEPAFSIYEPLIKSVGGIVKFVTLKAPEDREATNSSDLKLNYNELENAFNANTKMIIVNSPNNPTGKVFNKEECTIIANLCKKWNVICLCDDVYEELVYPPNKLFKIATLPDMWERTITVGTAGKLFHVTGWKIGWAYGSSHLINNLKAIFVDALYSCCTPIQEAIAICIENELSTGKAMLYKNMEELERNRNFMIAGLKAVGLNPIIPEAGYFVTVAFENLKSCLNLEDKTPKNVQFVKWLIENCKILAIPMNSFYNDENKELGEKYIRMTFIRDFETLKNAMDSLKAHIK